MEGLAEEDIIIVGAGIGGLATALALHRKGIRSVVVEKSEELRTAGVGIILRQNGWPALDQLGVASLLRQTSIKIHYGDYISIADGKRKKIIGSGELRCVKRIDLIKALADSLPSDTIYYGRQVVSIQIELLNSYSILHLQDGSVIKAKIVIGCDGVNSIVAKFIGLNPPKFYPICVVRGLSYYQNGHEYDNMFNMKTNNDIQLGIIPVNREWVYWFVTRDWTSKDSRISRDEKLIKESTMEVLNGFHQQEIELIKKTDSIHLTGVKYRAPWDFLISNFRKETVTVAGDAMHAMGPFLAQGGSASLEDAMMLANCLAGKIQNKSHPLKLMVEKAMDDYINRRKLILFWLSLQTYLIGTTLLRSSSLLKIFSIFLLVILFRDQ